MIPKVEIEAGKADLIREILGVNDLQDINLLDEYRDIFINHKSLRMRMNLLMILIARIEFCEKNVLYTGHRMRIYYSIFCLLVHYSFFVFLS